MSKQQAIALFVLVLAGFVTIFDLFVVNVAIVTIERSLKVSLSELTLILVGYELAFGLLLITGGRLGDIYGRKRLYQVGMACFTIASILCALSPSALLLNIGRFIQGLAAALLFPQVYASIRLNFDQQQAKKVFGYLGMSLGLAAIAGQTLGGWLITLDLFALSWRVIFLVNLPIGILALVLSRYLQESETTTQISLDWGGVFLSSLGICSSLIPLLMIPVWGWDLTSNLLLLLGMILLTLFVYYEIHLKKRGKMPLFDMDLLLNRPFVLGLFIVISVYSTSSAFPLMLSILLQNGLGLNPLESGLIFVPASIGFVLSSLLTPRWILKLGEAVVFWGAILYGLSYLLLILTTYLLPPDSQGVTLSPILFLIGFTQGMIMTPMLNLVLSKISNSFIGMASGFTATVQQIGAAVGATMVSVILQLALRHISATNDVEKLISAFRYSMSFNFLMALIASILLFYIIYRNQKSTIL
nr:MFS transporter [uncultured Moellerella sp.]